MADLRIVTLVLAIRLLLGKCLLAQRYVRIINVGHSGFNAVGFGSGTQYDSITQTVNVPNGFYYEQSFWVKTGQASNSVRAYAQFDGQSEQLLVEITALPENQYTKYSFILTPPRTAAAAMISLTVRFSGRNLPNFWFLDDVSLVQQGPVPPMFSAVGDPQFHGLLGQSYQIHGIDNTIYSIISQFDFSFTSRFVYLSSGRCPLYASAMNCWSHPGSYFGAIGIQTADGNKILIEAGDWSKGFSKVEINNKNINIGDDSEGNNSSSSIITIGGANSNNNNSLVLTLIDRYLLSIQYSIWIFHIDNSDMFVNINRVEISSWSQLVSQIKPHGLLGQTWKRQGRKSQEAGKQVKEVIEGDVDDYTINEGDGMFGYDFIYNKFHPMN